MTTNKDNQKIKVLNLNSFLHNKFFFRNNLENMREKLNHDEMKMILFNIIESFLLVSIKDEKIDRESIFKNIEEDLEHVKFSQIASDLKGIVKGIVAYVKENCVGSDEVCEGVEIDFVSEEKDETIEKVSLQKKESLYRLMNKILDDEKKLYEYIGIFLNEYMKNDSLNEVKEVRIGKEKYSKEEFMNMFIEKRILLEEKENEGLIENKKRILELNKENMEKYNRIIVENKEVNKLDEMINFYMNNNESEVFI